MLGLELGGDLLVPHRCAAVRANRLDSVDIATVRAPAASDGIDARVPQYARGAMPCPNPLDSAPTWVQLARS